MSQSTFVIILYVFYNQLMEFNSLFFIFIYLPIFIGLMYFIKNNKVRNIILLLFSIAFYCFGDIKHLYILLIIMALTYLFGLKVKDNKPLLIIYLILIIGLLSYFKYGNFLITSLQAFFKEHDWSTIIMPLGISFVTFLSISYVCDVYFKKYEAERNPLNIIMFLSFFPVVISGPLIRYDKFKTFIEDKDINVDGIASGLRRFIIGLGKKVIIANQLNIITSSIISDETKISTPLAWLAIIAYGIQEYYDFSGYSDMAIAIGEMIGFKIPENFNDPYFSHSIREYWRRWHMSLGSFIKDYIYIPLGGNRKGKKRKAINMFIALTLSGLWHGSTLPFLLWGIINGLLEALDAYFDGYSTIKNKLHINDQCKVWRAFQIIRTTLIAMILKVYAFKCSNFNQISSLFKASIGKGFAFEMSYLRSLDIIHPLIVLILGIILLFPFIKKKLLSLNEKVPLIYDLSLLFIAMFSVALIVAGSYSAFVYFQF